MVLFNTTNGRLGWFSETESRPLTSINFNRGRLATEEDVFGHDLEYTYDAAGRRTGLELDSSTLTSYAYDNANRLTTLTDESSNDFTFAYDNANKLTSKTLPNGIVTTYEYDGMSRIKRLKDVYSSTSLFDRQYSYNSANQISQIADLSNTRNFTYDNLDRLTGVTVGGSSIESYAYDAVGNRTSSHLSGSYTTSSFNRLTATSSASYSYNANGSMTGKTVGSTNWTFGWNRENKMISASDGTNSVSYDYDALGRRIKRTQGSSVSKFTHDGQDIVLDDENSTLTKYQNGLGIDDKLKLVTGGTSKYFLSDNLGSTNGLTNSSGAVTESNGYDSFGNGTNGSFSGRYQFTGREVDTLTGLQFSRARFYDQNLGRFVSEDPIGFAGRDINLYGYVGNRPMQFADPFGTFPSWWWPFNYHQQIGTNALNGIASPRDIQSINWANGDFDARTQDLEYANYHAMRRPGQSPEVARAVGNAFIRETICLARKYESMGWHTDAMHQIGFAVHALQDNESPAHTDFQEAWTNTTFDVLLNIWH